MHPVVFFYLSNLFTCALGLRINQNRQNDDVLLSKNALPELITLGNNSVISLADEAVFKQQESKEEYCSEPPVMWSRGFSRACCNVFVECYQRLAHGEGALNEGIRPDIDLERRKHKGDKFPHYDHLLQQLSAPHVKVYIPSLNMLEFIDTFKKLPSNASVTLVTGQEDVGVPRELWGEGRTKMRRVPSMGYKEFIADPRLNHWFTQNYDLTGCMAFGGCSNISEHSSLAQKVTPIPIGIDFHTQAEKQGTASVSSQVHELHYIRNHHGETWSEKQSNKLFMPFKDKKRDGTNHVNLPKDKAVRWTGVRTDMWKQISRDYMFVCTPFGRGADTHRLWETLNLGGVPVVRSSSLDRLLKQFPVIIVRDWKDVHEHSFEEWKSEIHSRFGPEPFNSAMYEKLGMQFWIGQVYARAKGESTYFSEKCLPTDTGRMENQWHCKHGR